MEVAQLAELNVRFGEAEKEGAAGEQFFVDVLDPSFRFRRGSGSVVDKEEFIAGLTDPGNRTDAMSTEIAQVQLLGDQAFVEALVSLKGSRGGTETQGVFRNLRLFERTEGHWRCVLWFNKRIGDFHD